MSLRLLSAKIQSRSTVLLAFSQRIESLTIRQVSISPALKITSIEKLENIALLHTDEIDIKRLYNVFVKSIGSLPLTPDGILNEYFSEKALGCTRENGNYVFRLFAPRAITVNLQIYSTLDDDIGTSFEMNCDEDGVWEISLTESYVAKYYCYRISGPAGPGEMFDENIAVADPYSHAVVTRNNYFHEARTQIIDHSFDWEDNSWMNIPPGDLIIYEMHVRDLTAHESSGAAADRRGKYLGLIQHGIEGGIGYIKSLGVNAVEIMPAQEFSSYEPPYKQLVGGALYNTWNPYERNHWGYMTSFFFAPGSYYASGTDLKKNLWCDADGRQVREFKEIVKTFHREGIAVIMDVVYNHTSQYDCQPLQFIDKKYYYHRDDHGNYLALSGCGNDFHTSRPMSRRLIIDSLMHLMKEYHVDGFRFDLAAMIDWDTIEDIVQSLRAINPDLILIAEPWGGGLYDPAGFSERGMAAWNDIFRNEVKGHNPHNATGFIFGHVSGDVLTHFRKWVLGCNNEHEGPFEKSSHSVNYVEAHDGYTLGDFIRIAEGEVHAEDMITDIDSHAKLSPVQLQIHQLAAFMLMVCKGEVMIHEGQEFGRSKLIAPTMLPDTRSGRMDVNSYEKDDETNWLNYHHAGLNKRLIDYYRGLIGIRKMIPELRQFPDEMYRFVSGSHALSCGFVLHSLKINDDLVVVFVNVSPKESALFVLPEGMWSVLVDSKKAGLEVLKKGLMGQVDVPVQSGMLLVKEYESRFG